MISPKYRRAASALGLTSIVLAGGAFVTLPTGMPASAAGAETQALLGNRRVSIYPGGRADLAAGRIDMRVVRLLQAASARHAFTVSSLKTGHDKYVAGTTSISNHFVGRGVDISVVDGQAVRPNSGAGRALRERIMELTRGTPIELGGPWKQPCEAHVRCFTNQAHQNHLHIGFRTGSSSGGVTVAAGPRIAALAVSPTGGAWAVTSQGRVLAQQGARPFSTSNLTLDGAVVAAFGSPSGNGLTLVTNKGASHALGDARFLLSLAGRTLNQPVVAAFGTPSGNGITMVTADGGSFAAGDAPYLLSLAGKTSSTPVVAAARTLSGRGITMATAGGTTHVAGDAQAMSISI
ncbi:MAG: hypothetical protein WKF86_03410 [Acidimicrobiales bacterium]